MPAGGLTGGDRAGQPARWTWPSCAAGSTPPWPHCARPRRHRVGAAGAGDRCALALGALSELVGAEALASAGGRRGGAVATGRRRRRVCSPSASLRPTSCGRRPLAAGETDVDRLVAVMRSALGAHQPVLPVFSLAAGAELAASIADRAALLGGDDTAPVTWLHRAGLVRAELDPLCGLLTHAEAGGADVVAELAVAQLPHRPGARWCELPFGAEGPPPAGTVGIVAHAPDGFDPTRPLAGLFVDAWAEVIPSAEHTAGVAFHYDAPGARPPQAIVLAVHPDVAPGPLEPPLPARDRAGDDRPGPAADGRRCASSTASPAWSRRCTCPTTTPATSVGVVQGPRRRGTGRRAGHRPHRDPRQAMSDPIWDLPDRRARRRAGEAALGRHVVAPGAAGAHLRPDPRPAGAARRSAVAARPPVAVRRAAGRGRRHADLGDRRDRAGPAVAATARRDRRRRSTSSTSPCRSKRGSRPSR